MKVIILIFLVFYFPHLFAQDLKNTEWTQIKVEKKDGSKNLARLPKGKSIMKYYFREKTVLLTLNNLYTSELTYSVSDKILSIGEFAKYKIDTIDSKQLVLTQIPNRELTDDKINRFTFLNRPSLFEYLKENGKIEIVGDSIIESNEQFAPTYYGDIDKMFMTEFEHHNENKNIFGIYFLDSKGKIENIQFEENRKFSKKEIEKFTEIMKVTNGFWTLPQTPKPYKYKVNFEIYFTSFQSFSGIGFSYVNKGLNQDVAKQLTQKEITEADSYFFKGNDLTRNKKYENASKQFIRCIEIDSLYLDAYYNLAFCYQKLGNKNLACEIWSKLKIMEQKEGENLYNENCR